MNRQANEVIKEMRKAYSDEMLQIVLERHLRPAFSDPKVSAWFRDMIEHWYKLGREDARPRS